MSLKNNYPTIMPSLAMDFVNCTVLSPRVTFSRSSIATRVNSIGLIETVGNNVPRFDYDPVTLAPKGLLIEESRTNLALNSNTFNASVGTSENLNATTSPDGTQNASLITETTTSGEHYSLDRTIAITLGNTYVWSFYAKQGAGSARKAYCRVATAASASVIFDLTTGNGAIISSTNLVTYGSQQLSNGWRKCYIVFTAGSTGNAVCRAQLIRASDNTSIYTGDGVSGLYFWGAQLEAGAFPTSYIPTTSAQVTRTADNASMTGTNFSSWYNQSEGTVATEYDVILNTGNRIIFNIGANGTFNTTAYGVQTNTYIGLLPGSAPVNMSSTVDTTTLVNKIAAGLQTNNSTISVNTVLGTTDTSCNMPASATTLTLGCSQFGSVFGSFLNGHIKSFKYYPQRLSNAQLQTLSK